MNLVKSNLILGGLAVGLLVPTMMTLSNERELFKDIARIPLMFDGFSADNTAAVVIGVPKAEQPEPAQGQDQKQQQVAYDSLAFQRADNGWVLGQTAGDLAGAPINADLLKMHVFEHIAAIPSDPETVVVAEASDEQLVEFGLDKEHAFAIKAVNSQQQPVAELFVGPTQKARGTETASGVYLRASDSNTVVFYEGDGRMPFAMRQLEARYWLDKTLLRTAPERIRKFSLRNDLTGETPVVFARPEGSELWECENPPAGKGALRQGEVARLAQILSNLFAQDYVGKLQGKNLAGLGLYLDGGRARAELTVTYVEDDEQKTEKVLQLWSGDKVEDKNENYVRVEGNAFLMTWAAHYADQIQDPGELFDPAK